MPLRGGWAARRWPWPSTPAGAGRPLALPAGDVLPEGSAWKDALAGGTARVEGGVLRGLTLAPRSAVVLVRVD